MSNTAGSRALYLRKAHLLPAFLLLLTIGLGLFIRIEHLGFWLENKQHYFFSNQSVPVQLSADAYYYLDIAKDLRKSDYTPFDGDRHIPDGYARPSVPPLLSVLLAFLSFVTGFSIEWVGLILPTILGAILGIPVYLTTERLFRNSERNVSFSSSITPARIGGLTASLITVISPIFAIRTSLGWSDTDGLVVFFSMSAVYLAMQFLLCDNRKRRSLWFFACSANLFFFLWTWDQTFLGAFILGLAPFGIAFFFFAYEDFRSAILYLPLIILTLAIVVYWKGLHVLNPLFILDNLTDYLNYFTNTTAPSSHFPASGSFVGEQRGQSLAELAGMVTGNIWVLAAAFSGVLITALFSFRLFTLLLPIIVVSFLSFEALRFEIFMAPVAGIGVGALAFLLWHSLSSPLVRKSALAIMLGLGSYSSISYTMLQHLGPGIAPVLFDAMLEIKDKTPANSIIWAQWSLGHPLIYFAERGTISDGIQHSAKIMYAANYPLTVSSFRLAANWIQFFTTHGMNGLYQMNRQFGNSASDWENGMAKLQELLLAGPEESRIKLLGMETSKREKLLKYLFPGASRPVFLFQEYLYAKTTTGFNAGAWSFSQHSYPPQHPFLPLKKITPVSSRELNCTSALGQINIDLQSGVVLKERQKILLDKMFIYYKKTRHTFTYPNHSGYQAGIHLPAATGAVGTTRQMETIFSKLFYELNTELKYFKPLVLRPPAYCIWRVMGDKYRPQTSDS